MTAAEFLGEELFSVVLTAGRVAYLIKPGSVAGFRRAIQEACTRWGGMTEPIIPVHARGRIEPFWRQVVTLAGVDEVVNVDLEVDVAAAASRSLGLPLIPLENIDHDGPGRFSCHPSVIATPDPPSPWIYADSSLELWAVVAAGCVASISADSTIIADDIAVGTRFPDQVARAQTANRTLIARSVSQFEEFRASAGPFSSPAIIWVAGKRPFRDCVFFWNCRALRSLTFAPIPMALLPEDELDHWLNFSASIQSMVAHRPDEFSPDVLMGSVVVSHERLREIGALLGLTETSDEIRTSRSQPPPPERTPPYTFKVGFDIREPFIFERGYGRVTWTHAQVFRDRTNLKLDSPVEFCGYGQVLLRIGSSAFKSLPQRPEVASLVQTFSTWSPDGLQISTMAMARYMIPIRVPAPQEVVNVVLQSRGVGWNLSDKGRIAESIRQTASLGDLLDVGMYEAIRSLTTRRSRQLMKNIQARKHTSSELELAQFVSDIGGRFERLSQHANQIEHVSKQVRVPVLERLVSIGWAEQGCRIVCTSCGITSFIPLAVVDPLATCPGCRRGQQFESTATGVTIFYRLNSLIDRASDQGVLPHLLVQAVLNRADPGSLVLPGIDVNFSDGTRAEVDLFGVFRGKVVAGEVKTSPDDFNSLQLRRDFDLSTRLGVDTHIMAALGELPEEARVEAQRHAKRLRIELMILDNKDLRPTVALLSANGR